MAEEMHPWVSREEYAGAARRGAQESEGGARSGAGCGKGKAGGIGLEGGLCSRMWRMSGAQWAHGARWRASEGGGVRGRVRDARVGVVGQGGA